jgi:DNA topoisomerase-3
MVELAEPGEYCKEWGSRKWQYEMLPMIPDEYRTVVKAEAYPQYDVLARLMNRRDVDGIICATDADREGEGIFRRVYEKAGIDKPVLRLWTASLEAEALREALEQAKDWHAYDGLAEAAWGRAVGDWLVGMNVSRALGALYGRNLPAGRVQTPTLAMIVRRDEQITSFVSKPFYQLVADLGEFKCTSERFSDRHATLGLAETAKGAPARVSQVETEKKRSLPPRLYDLVSLQKDASKIFGLTAAEGLAAAQALYEKRLLTYPRVESVYITAAERGLVEGFIDGIDRLPFEVEARQRDAGRLVDNEKVAGHHAILPTLTSLAINPEDLAGPEKAVYTLVVMRLLAALDDPFVYLAQKVDVDIAGIAFSAHGRHVVSKGYTRYVVSKAKEEEGDEDCRVLPEVSEGDELAVLSLEVQGKATRPPKHYSDDTLLAAMQSCGKDLDEERLREGLRGRGIGTPATRAGIIEGLIGHEYVERKGKRLTSTAKGRMLVSLAPAALTDAELTGKWEYELSRIEGGEVSLETYLSAVAELTRRLVERCGEEHDPSRLLTLRPSVGPCPVCGGRVRETRRSWSCESNRWAKDTTSGEYVRVEGCGFAFNKQIAKKVLSKKNIECLLEKGRTAAIKGFISKTGKAFEARLVVKDGRVSFDFEGIEKKTKVGK